MRMKISLALGRRQPLSRQTAWGCLTSNLALPGSGSLLAGRVSGYAQMGLGLAGMVMTVVFGLQFVHWYFVNWPRMRDAQDDPVGMLAALWFASRWTLLGFAVFAAGWLWGLASGLAIVHEARTAPAPAEPPRLG